MGRCPPVNKQRESILNPTSWSLGYKRKRNTKLPYISTHLLATLTSFSRPSGHKKRPTPQPSKLPSAHPSPTKQPTSTLYQRCWRSSLRGFISWPTGASQSADKPHTKPPSWRISTTSMIPWLRPIEQPTLSDLLTYWETSRIRPVRKLPSRHPIPPLLTPSSYQLGRSSILSPRSEDK